MSDEAASIFQEQAVRWSLGAVSAYDVVGAACDALVAGLDSAMLRTLAACTRTEADYEVPQLLSAAVDELGLVFYPLGSRGGEEAAARALAAQLVAGRLTPRELASQIHQRFGHGLPLVQRLAELDDQYDVIEYIGRTVDQVDAEVTAEAERILRT